MKFHCHLHNYNSLIKLILLFSIICNSLNLIAQEQLCNQKCIPITINKISVQNNLLIFGGDTSVYAVDFQNRPIWRFPTNERIYSMPAIYDKKVVAGSYDKHIYCLDLYSGKLKWAFSTDNLPIYSTPIVDNGIIYVGSGAGQSECYLYAISLNTGTLIWKFKVYGSIFSSPTIANNILFFGAGDYNFYAIDKFNGQLVWKYSTDGTSYRHFSSSPCYTDSSAIVGNDDGFLYAFDKKTGIIKWKFDTGIWGIQSSPTVYNDKIIFGSGNGDIYAINKENGILLWKTKVSYGNITNAPIVEENLIFISQGSELTALNLFDGKIVWQKYIGSTVLSSPNYFDGKLLVGSRAGQIDALRVYTIEPHNGEILSSFLVNYASTSPVVYSFGKVFYSGDSGSRN